MKTNRIKLFFDLEFSGLHQKTTPISLGIVASNGLTFYAEFTDFDQSQINDWIEKNVMKYLSMKEDGWLFNTTKLIERQRNVYGDKNFIAIQLVMWLQQFEQIEFWGDVPHYDWVLFCEIFGGAFSIPKNIYYIPFDIATMFRDCGIDPDIDRVKFINEHSKHISGYANHHSLADATKTLDCYFLLEKILNERKFSTTQ